MQVNTCQHFSGNASLGDLAFLTLSEMYSHLCIWTQNMLVQLSEEQMLLSPAEAKYLQGQGVARQRQAIVSGLRESVLTFQRDVKDIGARDVIEVMMMTQ